MFENKPYELHHGDCLEVMEDMLQKGESVVLTLTDIPYDAVNRKSNGLRNLNKEGADTITFDLSKFLDLVYEITKGTIIIFCGHEQYGGIYDYFNQKAKNKQGTVRGLFWHKTNPSPMNGQYIYLNSVEVAVWFKKRGATFNGFCKHNLFETSSGSRKIHPTQKNLSLFEELILDNSKEDDIVFDPCFGSATTAVSCLNTNRRFIGVELDKEYFTLAKERVENTYSELNVVNN